MTTGEQKMSTRGIAAGTVLGFAMGLIFALYIAMRPDLFTALIR